MIIHCRQGLSRSPALIIVALAIAGRPLDAVYSSLATIKDVQPNRLVLAHGDTLLGLNGELVRRANATFAYRRGYDGAMGTAQDLTLI